MDASMSNFTRVTRASLPPRGCRGPEATIRRADTLDSFLAAVQRDAWRAAEIALRDPDAALDAVQEAMLRLVGRYASRPADEWPPLFWRILYRRIADLHRRQAVRDRIFVWCGQRPVPPEEEPAPSWDVNDQAPGPAQIAETRQAYAALSTALRQLPRRQQQVFVLRVLEELDVADTARAMDCGVGSVKTHLSRALKALRTRLEDWQ